MKRPPESPWLLFIHQIPKDPAYLRVKVGRRLANVGAVAIKNSVYLLPNLEACREDFSWLRREVLDGGGEAVVFAAEAVEGLAKDDLERLFREAREDDYQRLSERISEVEGQSASGALGRQAALTELARIDESLGSVERIAFFSGSENKIVRERLKRLRAVLEHRQAPLETRKSITLRQADYQERIWVTREGVKVDRMACAWLITRFIDKHPKFRFVDQARYAHRKGEIRFDMPEGELTHEGDLCSFEVICQRFGLKADGVRRIAEIVHDLDIKDGRYAHPESEGIRLLIQGLVTANPSDLARIAVAFPMFDALCAAEPKPVVRKKR